MAKLTEKQKLFCENYLTTMNAVDAYLAVYKNCKSRDNASKHASGCWHYHISENMLILV